MPGGPYGVIAPREPARGRCAVEGHGRHQVDQNTLTQVEYAERAESARAELASALGSAPSPEAEAKARALLKRLGGARHGSQTAA
ncbi:MULTISPECIES: hypothetical protein [unclassified Streptomyces]|uniref:hypothetical protein n=1 Tax=unclassified Streptomyces TaxID=2593676 RepID=UPI0037FAFEC9